MVSENFGEEKINFVTFANVTKARQRDETLHFLETESYKCYKFKNPITKKETEYVMLSNYVYYIKAIWPGKQIGTINSI